MVKRHRKTAVVVIHGIGEQIPMQTLRGFVRAVWSTDDSLFDPDRPSTETGGARTENPVWSKPDTHSRSFELRRLTTERAKNGRACDFYELYWADLMEGTTWEHLWSWISGLLFRCTRRVPGPLFAAWILLWVLSIAAFALLLWSLLPAEEPAACADGALCWAKVRPVAVGLGGLLLARVNVILLTYVGDVARYVSATPTNVGRRQAIRERGVALLEELMGVPGEGKPPPAEYDYDRIVVVGHSLGAVVGYDILKFAFSRHNDRFTQDEMAEQPARDALEQMVRAAAAGAPLDRAAFRDRQDAARAEYVACGYPWIVSDFVTLGSPLTHASVILAADAADLRAQQEARNLPTCPPEMELDRTTDRQHFSYWPGKRRDADNDREARLTRIPHHAAHFGLTRWTNLYSPAHAIFWGDLISGPVAQAFGIPAWAGGTVPGIEDVAVMTGRFGAWPLFTHTRYWDLDGRTGAAVPEHVKALRAALDLARG